MASPGLVHGHAQKLAVQTATPRPAGAWSWLVAVISLVLVVSIMSSRYLLADSFYDLYTGRYILQHGLPRQNVLTWASHGTPWVDQQWLAHVLYYLAWRAGGYPALAAASVALIASGFAGLALLMLRRGVPPTRMFAWTAAAVLACSGFLVIRAESFAYPCLAATLWLVTADSRAARIRPRTWLALPVLVLWANTHGSVLLGAVLVAGYAGYRAVLALRRRDWPGGLRYLGFGVLAAGSVLCTPYGTGVIGYYQRFIGNAALRHNVLEWTPPNPRYLISWGFFALLAATTGAVVVAWRRGARPDPVLCGLAMILLAAALTAIRNQAWFGFGGSLLAADTLARSSGRVPELSRGFRRAVTGILIAAALGGVGILAVTSDQQFESLIPRRAIDAVAVLAARHPAWHVLGDDWSSSPILWLHPALLGRVGYDARLEQYSAAQIGAYTNFLYLQRPGWLRAADGYDLIVVGYRQHRQLIGALIHQPGWRVVYSGHDGLVFERPGGR